MLMNSETKNMQCIMGYYIGTKPQGYQIFFLLHSLKTKKKKMQNGWEGKFINQSKNKKFYFLF